MTTDEILQISNDISEDMLSPKVTKAKLVEVIKFFRNIADEKHDKYMRLVLDLGSLFTGSMFGLTEHQSAAPQPEE